jgi:hypothetical protein
MVSVVPRQEGRVDTRGLPEGYDPHNFYEYRYQHAFEKADSVERFLYQFIPLSLVKSLAISLDPTYKFKVSPAPITPQNRTKRRYRQSVLQTRSVYAQRFVDYDLPYVNFGNVGGCYSPFQGYYHSEDPPFHGSWPRQEPLPDTLVDTTSRTRLIGSTQGELSLFKGTLFSGPRQLNTKRTVITHNVPSVPPSPTDACIVAGGTYNYNANFVDRITVHMDGQSALLSPATHSSLITTETDYNLDLSQAHAIDLLKGWSPFTRDYNLFRNIVELRDLPRSILSLRETLGNLRKLYVSLSHSPSIRKIIFDLTKTGKDIPNEYLSYHFGWKQTYQDLRDLLFLPGKLAKKYNFLIRRAGKPTTFRSKRSFVSGESGVSGFDYSTFDLDIFDTSKGDGIFSRKERQSEVRLIVNATFDFPPVETVLFRDQNFFDRIGFEPRPTDLYNLVPWTWLIDWFSGLGSYVELIDNNARDPSLINWGMITCVSTGKLITELQSRTRSSRQLIIDGVTVSDVEYYDVNKHSSIFEYTCETRRDIATFLDVSRTSVPTSLSDYKRSILGALLAQRADFSRKSAFTPRS